MGKALRLAGVVLVMLLVAAIPAGADTEIKLTTTLTALNPVTGQVTGDPDGRGTAEFTFDIEQGTVCYELEVEGISEPVEPAPGLGSAHIHFVATGGIAVDLEAPAATTLRQDRAVLPDLQRRSQACASLTTVDGATRPPGPTEDLPGVPEGDASASAAKP